MKHINLKNGLKVSVLVKCWMGEREMNKEDLIIDDSEMLKKLEKSQKEINDKIDKISKEIYDEVMEYRKNKKKDNGDKIKISLMDDLERVEKNFQDFIRNIYPENDIPVDLPEITEKLLEKQWGIDLPGTFGGFDYFLAIEDEKPILYLKAFSRMDNFLDRVAIVDEESFKWVENVDYNKKLKEHGLR